MAMNLQSTKESVIKRVEQVDDIDLLNALNSLLDYGLRKQEAGGGSTDPAFLASLERGLAQSARGEGRSHQEVMQELRNKYSE